MTSGREEKSQTPNGKSQKKSKTAGASKDCIGVGVVPFQAFFGVWTVAFVICAHRTSSYYPSIGPLLPHVQAEEMQDKGNWHARRRAAAVARETKRALFGTATHAGVCGAVISASQRDGSGTFAPKEGSIIPLRSAAGKIQLRRLAPSVRPLRIAPSTSAREV